MAFHQQIQSQVMQLQQIERSASQQAQQIHQMTSQLTQQMSQLNSLMSQVANQIGSLSMTQTGFSGGIQGTYQPTTDWSQRSISTPNYGQSGQFSSGGQYGMTTQTGQYGYSGQTRNPGDIPTGHSAFNTNKDLNQ
ncbi:hypothetical protein [Phosphitispora sp. TUW77]|uniref:hypothetical protein n=1 Tax=Phosphitispora sp. TUW77 TaxID=3152361 RepID=UPI003AB7551A